MTEETENIDFEKQKTKAVKRSARAGLKFPVGKIHRHLKKQVKQRSISSTTAVYLAADLEFLTIEYLKLAGDESKHSNKKSILPSHLKTVLRGNSDLDQLIRATVDWDSGTIPRTNESLIGQKETGDFQQNKSVIQSEGNTLKMEFSPSRPQHFLTIEARHTLSLQESKKRRQQYEQSLFLPQNVRREFLLNTMNRRPVVHPSLNKVDKPTNQSVSNSNQEDKELSSKTCEPPVEIITCEPIIPPDYFLENCPHSDKPPKKRFRFPFPKPVDEKLIVEETDIPATTKFRKDSGTKNVKEETMKSKKKEKIPHARKEKKRIKKKGTGSKKETSDQLNKQEIIPNKEECTNNPKESSNENILIERERISISIREKIINCLEQNKTSREIKKPQFEILDDKVLQRKKNEDFDDSEKKLEAEKHTKVDTEAVKHSETPVVSEIRRVFDNWKIQQIPLKKIKQVDNNAQSSIISSRINGDTLIPTSETQNKLANSECEKALLEKNKHTINPIVLKRVQPGEHLSTKTETETEQMQIDTEEQGSHCKKPLPVLETATDNMNSQVSMMCTLPREQESPHISSTNDLMPETAPSVDMLGVDSQACVTPEKSTQFSELRGPVMITTNDASIPKFPVTLQYQISSASESETTSNDYVQSVPIGDFEQATYSSEYHSQPPETQKTQRYDVQQKSPAAIFVHSSQNQSPIQPNIQNQLNLYIQSQQPNVQETNTEPQRAFQPPVLRSSLQYGTGSYNPPLISPPIYREPPNVPIKEQKKAVIKPKAKRKASKTEAPKSNAPPPPPSSVVEQAQQYSNNDYTNNYQNHYNRMYHQYNQTQNPPQSNNRPNAENIQQQWPKTYSSNWNVMQQQMRSNYNIDTSRSGFQSTQQPQSQSHTFNSNQKQMSPIASSTLCLQNRQNLYRSAQNVTENNMSQQPTTSTSYPTNNQNQYYNYNRSFNVHQQDPHPVQMEQLTDQQNIDDNLGSSASMQYIQHESFQSDEPVSNTGSYGTLEAEATEEPFGAIDQGFQTEPYPSATHQSHEKSGYSDSRYQQYHTNLHYSDTYQEPKVPTTSRDMRFTSKPQSQGNATTSSDRDYCMSNGQHPVASTSASERSNFWPQHNANNTKLGTPSEFGNWMAHRVQQPVESNMMLPVLSAFDLQQAFDAFFRDLMGHYNTYRTPSLPAPSGWQPPVPNPTIGCNPHGPSNNGGATWNSGQTMNFRRNEANTEQGFIPRNRGGPSTRVGSSYPVQNWSNAPGSRRIEGPNQMTHTSRALQINAADSTTEVNTVNSNLRHFRPAQQFHQHNLTQNSAANNMNYTSNTMNHFGSNLNRQQSNGVSGVCWNSKANLPEYDPRAHR